MSYFLDAPANIVGNSFLREPQEDAYRAIYDHFVIKKSEEHALVTLPTGTGKTGLMGIAPYKVSEGRVLIITPQTVIRDSVLGSLDPTHPKNFWMFSRVFDEVHHLPTLIEYEKTLTDEIIQQADIVVLNIHKLQERLDSSLLRRVDRDFFDMIIIDEAHHAEAKTWKRAIEYFEGSKVLKVTGTPFRSDGRSIEGKEIYKYSLAQAMAKGYVKSLEKIDHVPDQMFFTLDNDDTRTYTLDELRDGNIREENWIQRSVALSRESNEKIVDLSLKYLKEKQQLTNNPHKIIAVACSIDHAEDIRKIYSERGYESSIVHSKLEKFEQEKELNKINDDKVDVVINVAMLGEGYDHKFLSIAAIFRPFKTLLPYAQFIGRTLRAIESEDGTFTEEDNTAVLIHHKELGLEPLWEYYKKEKIKRDAIKKIKEDKNLDLGEAGPKDLSKGEANESEDFKIEKDTFVETELIRKRKEKLEEENKKIRELQELLGIDESKARDFIRQSKKSDNSERLLRPDKFYFQRRKDLDTLIREELIPELVADFNFDLDGDELVKGRYILPRKGYGWIYGTVRTNGALLGTYFNSFLKNELKGSRDEWSLDQYEEAIELARSLDKYIREIMDTKKGENE
ncbi:DEAD/DEAH box helicase family protein [Sporosarcina sp. ACRSM]|uniref:DEAD/DEAH box helicase n=1 Tax=Sporosarcina sp. ACRSM TaxID=2918216 RepID=UPI001EF5C45A|nr:DEAD/DEAH box helicase family protein [Sporosarcina sp. ACRSM]MCG7337153.1 DEAD/DEAH box helicase family protein [Sporosarcina sp. ACRSM]